MYKLCITDKYELHTYKGNGIYEMLNAFNSVKALKEYVKIVMDNLISPYEIEVASKFMEDTSHNTAEFGYNGTFTVSYYDEEIEE